MVNKATNRAPQGTLSSAKGRIHLGMTIVEIMVVLTIMASMMGIAVLSMGAIGGDGVKSSAIRLTAVMKYTYANAAINNTQYRLVIDLDTGKYHTEIVKAALTNHVSGAPPAEGNDEDFLTEEAKRLAEKVEEKSDLFDEKEENPFGISRKISYERIADIVVKDETLKSGVRFAKVATAGKSKPVDSGIVTISFYPNGFQEQSYIVLTDEEGAAITLMTKPLSGRVKSYTGEKALPDDFFEVENDD